jgi:hypothetical protein
VAFLVLLFGGLGAVLVPRIVSGFHRVSAVPRLTPQPGATLPPDVASDFPVYPGAVLVEARSRAGGSSTAVWESNDDPERVYSFYRTQLGKSPWRVLQAIDLGPLKQVQFERGNQPPMQLGGVLIQPSSGGGCTIVLQLSTGR